jgi:hypothetical protein
VSSFHNVAVSRVELSETWVTVGDTVTINVTVRNLGYFAETVNVTVFFDGDEIGSETDRVLAIGGELVLTFSWDTASVPWGEYEITAEVSDVMGETEVSDNVLIAGTMTFDGLECELSIESSSASLMLGESTTISGAIDPARVGTSVTIWARLDDGAWEQLFSATTSAAGAYSYLWTPDDEGAYLVYASWVGDDFTMNSASPVLAVVVAAEPPPPGINVFLISTAALGVLWLVTLVYFIRLKKP